jgi:hypothetical protein
MIMPMIVQRAYRQRKNQNPDENSRDGKVKSVSFFHIILARATPLSPVGVQPQNNKANVNVPRPVCMITPNMFR